MKLSEDDLKAACLEVARRTMWDTEPRDWGRIEGLADRTALG